MDSAHGRPKRRESVVWRRRGILHFFCSDGCKLENAATVAGRLFSGAL